MTLTLIAEMGSSPAPAWDFGRWCAAAAEAGATHVKAQMFRAEHFPAAEQASKRPLEFPRERLSEFLRVAHNYGLNAGVSVFDAEAVELAARHCDFLKLAAREQENRELIRAVAEAATNAHKPYFRSITKIKNTTTAYGATNLLTLQKYPAPLSLSLLAVTLAAWYWTIWPYRLEWGWSSHTTGMLDCLWAVRLGASVVEKHLALSPDDLEAGHSLLPSQFAKLAAALNR